MTDLINLKNAVKNDFIKFISIVIVVVLMGYGIVSSAIEDTKPITVNFSVLGIVSNISDDGLKIEDAKGSDRSGKTTYNLNIENLTKLETDKNVPINYTDIKVGDKIIAQGLTNGSTYFIKRVISFTSVSTVVATTTEEFATSTATTTEEVVTTVSATTSTDDISVDILSTTTEVVLSTSTDKPIDGVSIPISTLIDNSTSTEIINTSTTTEETSTSTNSVIETVANVLEDIINTVTDTIQDAVDTVTGNNDQVSAPEVLPAPENPPTTPVITE